MTSIGQILQIRPRSGTTLLKAPIQNHCALPAKRMEKKQITSQPGLQQQLRGERQRQKRLQALGSRHSAPNTTTSDKNAL